MVMTNKASWLVRTKAQPRLRLFCFPYAGGGASIYRQWSSILPSEIEVCPIQLPGRENRFVDPAYTHIAPLIEDLVPALLPYMDIPYMIFGHSMGAIISFEFVRQLRRLKERGPEHLFVSAHRAPQLLPTKPPIYALPEPEFIEALYKLGGTPEAVLQNEELMRLFAPILRADFAICETYTYSEEAPLTCPIYVFGGEHDADVPSDRLPAWRAQTQGAFALKMFPGQHFFIHSHQNQLLQVLARYLHV